MKTPKLLLAISGMLLLQNSFAQAPDHLKLSTSTPAVGNKVTFTYDPKGTPLEGKENPEALVYFLDNKDYPAADLTLKPNGKVLTGVFTVPAIAKGLLFRIFSGDDVDDNGGKGYVYLVYKNGKPVEGANAVKAYTYYSGLGAYLSKIKNDNNEALELYKKEFALYPSSKNEFANGYYSLLAGPKMAEHWTEVDNKIAELIKSNNEKDLSLAASLAARIKKKSRADSLGTVIKEKFPNGLAAKSEAMNTFYSAASPIKKDSILTAYFSRFPDSTATKSEETSLRTVLAVAYLNKGMIDEYNRQAALLTDKSGLAMALNNVAWDWAVKGEKLTEAETLSKQSLDILAAKMAKTSDKPMMFASPGMVKKADQSSLDLCNDTYAYILYKLNKPAEALPYIKQVYEHNKGDELSTTEHYAMILLAAGQNEKAMQIIEKGMGKGQSSADLKAELAKAYVKVKGSDKGYTEYAAAWDKKLKMMQKEKYIKQMINTPAPAFALKDFDGKEVSLASLKGKTIVVDFWATWCGPCKASFPGMQMAVNKYKDDPNVKFLFIDTWERGDDYLPEVKKFIADNKYTFHVLVDEKAADGKQGKVVSQFKVEGIPTKFVIDQNGSIRFKYVGYSGSNEKVLEEVVNMIDLTTDPDIAVATARPVKKSASK